MLSMTKYESFIKNKAFTIESCGITIDKECTYCSYRTKIQ